MGFLDLTLFIIWAWDPKRVLTTIKFTNSEGTYKVIKNKWRKKKRNEIKRQLITVIWKIERWSRGIRNKIEMARQRTLKTLQCNKINHYIHLIKFVRTYVIHLLGTYVTILCNWLILWKNAFYLYLGRSRMCFNTSTNLISSSSVKTMQVCPRFKLRKCLSLKLYS